MSVINWFYVSNLNKSADEIGQAKQLAFELVNNLAISDKVADEIVNDVEFYYPVSPKLGILISEKEKYSTISEINLQDEDANAFNMAMIAASHEQIYADSREILERYFK